MTDAAIGAPPETARTSWTHPIPVVKLGLGIALTGCSLAFTPGPLVISTVPIGWLLLLSSARSLAPSPRTKGVVTQWGVAGFLSCLPLAVRYEFYHSPWAGIGIPLVLLATFFSPLLLALVRWQLVRFLVLLDPIGSRRVRTLALTIHMGNIASALLMLPSPLYELAPPALRYLPLSVQLAVSIGVIALAVMVKTRIRRTPGLSQREAAQ